MLTKIAVFCVVVFTALEASADVKPNGLFSDNAVLQQGTEVPVWGTAREGETVTVEFAEQKVSTVAKDEKWIVRLKDLKAGGPSTLTITGDNVVTAQNILVGEVWVCSGQSNMARILVPPDSVQPRQSYWTEEAAQANYPQIRQFRVASGSADEPRSDVAGKWEICSPETAPNFTAVGYFFARDLFKARHVPVGLISAAVGATAASTWTNRESLEAEPTLRKAILDWYERSVKEYPSRLEKYKAEEAALMEQYNAALQKAQKENSPLPRKPAPPGDPSKDANRPSSLYNGKIAPLQPYAISGVLWYQGESNSGNARQYRTLFPALINGWRKAWGRGDFPFLFVQLAPYKNTGPEIREAQLQTWLSTPNTAMVVITDAADGTDIHPPDKRPVGARLALAARAVAHGEKIEYSGPLFETMTIEGNRVVLRFKHMGSGLMTKDGELKGFMIAGPDKKFVAAKAEIQGETVIVSSDQVQKPIAVRYGWANVPDGNLFNKEGLLASPFRTDSY
jgi:sialate O-acetylesterase